MGTTNSEAVVSISSIELHVFKSVILQKIQTKSTILKSLAKTEPVFESGNKTLENKSTDDQHTYISKVVGCLCVCVGGSTLLIFFSSLEITTWRDLQCLTYPENALKQKWIHSILPKSSYMKYICIAIERGYIKCLLSSKSWSFSFAHTLW